MVREDELLDACVFGNFDAFKPCAVTPTFFDLVFFRSELRIVDENVSAFGVSADDVIEGGVAMFVVASMNDDSAVGFEAVAGSALGVI